MINTLNVFSSMGLNHDNKMGECDATAGTEPSGFMGMNKAIFRDCYKKRLEAALAKRSCVHSKQYSGPVGSWAGK